MDICQKTILDIILKTDLSSFVHKSFNTLNPSVGYVNSWYLELIIEHLKLVYSGDIKRLIINIPPRNLKSTIVSVAWPCFLLGINPTNKIIVSSYSQSLSLKHSLDAGLIINSEWYQNIFPNVKLSAGSRQNKYITTKFGFRYGVSVGGAITGEGGDILIVDDPHNPTYVNSHKIRKKAIDWYEQTLSSRLNNSKKGAIVIVMQRLHQDDLVGYLLSRDKSWTVLKIPLIADHDYVYNIGERQYRFNFGELIDSTRYNISTVAQLESMLGVSNFAAQYMQSPIESASIVSKEMLVFYDKIPKYQYTLLSFDTAIKISDNADYSVCTIWGCFDNRYYLIDIFRKKVIYPELKMIASTLIKKWNPMLVLIEDQNSGQSLIQELQKDYRVIFPCRPKFDKITRLATNISMIIDGTVIFPRNVGWMNDVLKEITSFPNIKNDDIVDTISQLLSFIKNNKLQKEIKIRTLD